MSVTVEQQEEITKRDRQKKLIYLAAILIVGYFAYTSFIKQYAMTIVEDEKKRPLEFMGRGYGIWMKFALIIGAGWIVWKYVIKK